MSSAKYARFTLNTRKICALLFVVARLLQILQQISSQRPAGFTGGSVQLVKSGDLVGRVHHSKGLLIWRHAHIAGQSGADISAKVLHLVFHGSFLPGLRCARGARQNGCGHPVDDGHFGIFAVSLLVFHFDFLLFFVYGEQFLIQIIPCAAGKGNTEGLCRMARNFSASFLLKKTRVFVEVSA